MGMSNQTEEKDLFHAVSLSGGKDSTAMLLLMVERGLPIHAVLTADTGMEFPEMYEHLQKLDDYLFTERGLHLTWLRHPKGFEWLMFEEKKQRPASIENRQRLGVSLYSRLNDFLICSDETGCICGVFQTECPTSQFMKRRNGLYERKHFILYNTNRQNNFYCQCEAIGKCEEAFEYGVSRNMQTRDVGRFFSG